MQGGGVLTPPAEVVEEAEEVLSDIYCDGYCRKNWSCSLVYVSRDHLGFAVE